MKYYSDFQENNTYIKGIFRCINYNLGYSVMKNNTDIIIIEGYKNINRVFDGNLVEVEILDTNIENVENIENLKTKFNIVGKGQIKNLLSNNEELYLSGTLLINSRITYGLNKRNTPIYEFKPTNPRIPKFIVPSNYKKHNKDTKNVYALIKFKEWEVNQKIPIGTCEKIIGEIGIIENEYENLLYNFNINYSNYKKKEIEKYQELYTQFYKENNDFIREDYTSENTFSIDPENCKDIDDAVHITEYNDYYELGIHIADVSHYILENSYIENQCQKRMTSIYAPHKKINMLPNNYAEDICSLSPNEIKKSFSAIFKIDKNYNILDKKIIKTNIESKKAMSYEEAEKIIENKLDNNNINKDLIKLFELVNKMSISINNKSILDTHQLIEFLMVLTNKTIAENMYSYNIKNCILRTHSKNKSSKIEDIKDEELRKHIEIMHSNSAIYVSNISDNHCHESLNIDLYTHFTSPIRRYADLIVHRIMNNIIMNKNINNDWEETCEKINNVNKNIKKCEREIEKINFINQNIENQIFEAFITEIKPLSNKIQIFIKENKMSFYINIFSEKLKDIITCHFLDDKFELSYKNQNIKHTFELFQKINILVSTRIEADNINKKSIISLLDSEKQKIIDFVM